MDLSKTCSKCGRTLPLAMFSRDSRSSDGFQYVCKRCVSEYNRSLYALNREAKKAAVRQYKSENPEKVLETRLAICAKRPNQKNAYRAMDAAIAAGVMQRPRVCSGCGCSDSEHRIEAHHHDYTRPLDVIWLCTPCHRRLDQRRALREAARL